MLSRPCRKRRPSSRDDGGVSWVFWSWGASVGFLTRYDGDLREPLVRCQGSQVSMRVARGSVAEALRAHASVICLQHPSLPPHSAAEHTKVNKYTCSFSKDHVPHGSPSNLPLSLGMGELFTRPSSLVCVSGALRGALAHPTAEVGILAPPGFWAITPTPVFLGFPCGSASKESACNAGDLGLTPAWSGRASRPSRRTSG